MKKRITAIFLAATLMLGSLAGCSSTDTGSSGGSSSGTKSQSKVQPLNAVFYDKNGSLYYMSLESGEEILVAKDHGDSEWGHASEYGAMSFLSDNQKRFFYITPADDGSMYGGALYYRDVLEDHSLSDATRIAKSVDYYKVSSDGRYVIYSGDDKTYLYDVEEEEKTKLADELTYRIEISKDSKRAVYSHYVYEEDTMVSYELEFGSEPEELEQGIYNFVDVSDDLSEYYFVAVDNAVYKKSFGKEAEMLAEDVFYVPRIYDGGQFYYLSADFESTDFDVRDFIIDDMIDFDAMEQEVEYPDYPSREDYDTDEQWRAAYNEYNEMQELASRIEAKEYRDEIRRGLDGETLSTLKLSLHYFDGKKAQLVADFISEDFSYQYLSANSMFFENEPRAVFFSAFEFDKKVKMSELNTYFDTQGLLAEAMGQVSNLYIANGAEVEKVDLPGKLQSLHEAQLRLSGDEKSFVLLYKEKDAYNFLFEGYQCYLKGNSVGEIERIGKEIDLYPFYSTKDGRALFNTITTRGDYYLGDVHLGDEKIAEDARLLFFDKESEEFALIQDIDVETGFGTLVYFKDFEPQVVDDQVSRAFRTPAGELIYYKNVDSDSWVGDLYRYYDGESERIAKKAEYVDVTLTFNDLAG